jgi:hypothetical protein
MINIALGECAESVKNHEYSDRKYPRSSVNSVLVKWDSKIKKSNANGLLIKKKLKINKLGAYAKQTEELENINYCFT